MGHIQCLLAGKFIKTLSLHVTSYQFKPSMLLNIFFFVFFTFYVTGLKFRKTLYFNFSCDDET